ncbi:prolipoprotein diacylglyceryl transferase [Porphyromonas sp.]|uniref:prolipoprotein diacylglyceryl transferase n=1 Tax=Porphyromonas sp. TaxID=1924944 RepID=UPI0026DC82C2|nr:prolipoprotein diacylglyceryl transferase [Porphyromonas sp.]MDO4771211.1 prolipoprotein diacylglyceryl transferase [Porphyromonas sp.]
MLNVVTWTVDPIIVQIDSHIDLIGIIRIGWYGVLFGLGLIVIGYWLITKMWKHEQLPEKWLTSLFYATLIGTVVGARLGHCLFYAPEYYLANPIEIFKTWHGGLASHGGTVGVILALWWYSRKVTHKSIFWAFDLVAVPTGIVAMMIRLGNLMNHEIYGHATDVPWAFRFITNIPAWQQGAEPVFSAPSHPTQLYEALCYLITFLICMWLYWVKGAQKREGFIFGIFMACVFTSRFFIEFVKNNQSAFEEGMALNMGQLLSIPFILAGIASIVYSMRHNKHAVK